MFILADKDLEVKEIKKGTGEILSDVRINKKTGEWKEQPWKPYKSMNTVLDGIYDTALVIDPTCISPSAKFSFMDVLVIYFSSEIKRKVLKN